MVSSFETAAHPSTRLREGSLLRMRPLQPDRPPRVPNDGKEVGTRCRVPNYNALRQSLACRRIWREYSRVRLAAILWWCCAGPRPIILETHDSHRGIRLKHHKISTKLLFW